MPKFLQEPVPGSARNDRSTGLGQQSSEPDAEPGGDHFPIPQIWVLPNGKLVEIDKAPSAWKGAALELLGTHFGMSSDFQMPMVQFSPNFSTYFNTARREWEGPRGQAYRKARMEAYEHSKALQVSGQLQQPPSTISIDLGLAQQPVFPGLKGPRDRADWQSEARNYFNANPYGIPKDFPLPAVEKTSKYKNYLYKAWAEWEGAPGELYRELYSQTIYQRDVDRLENAQVQVQQVQPQMQPFQQMETVVKTQRTEITDGPLSVRMKPYQIAPIDPEDPLPEFQPIDLYPVHSAGGQQNARVRQDVYLNRSAGELELARSLVAFNSEPLIRTAGPLSTSFESYFQPL
ncbi:MAG: hypothetical protein KF874_11995 [Rhizobiaceae bacterium]|nr:hypothetical protein [Rhizobiaceae bacterium]